MSKDGTIFRHFGTLQIKATLAGDVSYRGILGLYFIQVWVADGNLGHKIQVQESRIDRALHRDKSGLCDINLVKSRLSIDNGNAMRHTGAAIVHKEDIFEICLRLKQCD